MFGSWNLIAGTFLELREVPVDPNKTWICSRAAAMVADMWRAQAEHFRGWVHLETRGTHEVSAQNQGSILRYVLLEQSHVL